MTLVAASVALGLAGQGAFVEEPLWNPVAGLCLFYLMRAGAGRWPWVLAACSAAIPAAGAGLGTVDALVVGAMMTLTYAVIARRVRGPSPPDSLRALAAPIRDVALGTLALCLCVGLWRARDGDVSWPTIVSAAGRDWIAELNGIMVLVPALALHARPGFWRWRGDTAGLVEAAAQAAAIALVLYAVFAIAAVYNVRFFSIIFLPLIWIVVRWGLHGSVLALAALQGGIVAGGMAGHVPSALQLALLTFALGATGLTLGAVVTQRRRVERRLEEKQAALNQALQLASVGEMTSALAHELSQPVAALSRYLGACEVLAGEKGDQALLHDTLRKATAEATRASDIVVKIRDFYRRGAVNIDRVDPARLLHSTVQSVQARALRANIGIVVRTAPLPDVAVDTLQVETSLLNVLNNAIDALGETAQPREIRVTATAGPGQVTIVIDDTGPGIDPQIAERLFEPFNTSKENGMGMGLAISRTLLRASGGEITAGPAGKGGAQFTITLPVAATKEAARG